MNLHDKYHVHGVSSIWILQDEVSCQKRSKRKAWMNGRQLDWSETIPSLHQSQVSEEVCLYLTLFVLVSRGS
jgi:hypothetical protein